MSPLCGCAVGESARLYFPAIDGLRFFAFLLVLVHHLGAPPNYHVMYFLHAHGWIGVELFFVISSFLLFHLLAAEDVVTGSINIINFYLRRLLRLYPLMVGFPLAMLLWSGDGGTVPVGRLLGIAVLSDNILSSIWGYNTIFASAHLWTLSYEFQIYLVIPLSFLIYKAMGQRGFLWLLVALWIVAVGARLSFILVGAKHPVFWVTPFLRPESTLLGIALAIGLLARARPPVIVAIGIAFVVAFTQIPNVNEIDLWTLALYPICAVICAALLWLTVNVKIVSAFLSQSWIVFLGKISFGLYVFHLLAIWVTTTALTRVGIGTTSDAWNYSMRLGMALALAIAMSTASYFLVERFFLNIKARFSAIPSRGGDVELIGHSTTVPQTIRQTG